MRCAQPIFSNNSGFQEQHPDYAFEATRNTLQTHPATTWNRAEGPRRCQQQPTARNSIFPKNTGKSDRNPSLRRIWPESDFENLSRQQSSILVDQTSSDATNDYQSLRNYPLGTHRANGSIRIDGHAPVLCHGKFKNSRKSENMRFRGQQKNQGTLGPSVALECKCAFGAKTARHLKL